MKPAKNIILAICMFFSFMLTGCYNYKDINKVVFATSILIDLKDSGNIIVYADTIKPFRDAGDSSEKGRRSIYKGEGKSLFEAIRNMNLSSSFAINYSQNKAVIFSEKAAKEGIGQYVDFLNRDQELNVRTYLFVYSGEVEKLMEIAANSEEYLGSFLNEIVTKLQASPRTVHLSLNDYLIARDLGSGIALITALKVEKEVIDDKIHLVGGAVMQGDKMVDKLELGEALSYNLLSNKLKRGTLEVRNPQDESKIVTLEIVNGRTKTDVEVSGENVKLIKRIKLRTSVGEVQGSLALTKDNLKLLESSAEENIQKYAQIIFKDYHEKGLDIFNIARELQMKYPKLSLKEPYKNAELVVYPDVYIEGSSTIDNAIEVTR